jgi:glycyl-tRNA synthetase
VTVGVFPLMAKEHADYALRVTDSLLAAGISARFDDGGTIGKRYARMDEAGTPYCVTVDGRTLEEGPDRDTVTLRDRDSKSQERVPVAALVARIAPGLAPPRPPRA